MRKKRVLTEEHKKKIGNALRGRKRFLSEEAIKNIQEAAHKRKGIKTGQRTEEVKRKISKANRGKKKDIKNKNPTWFKKGHVPWIKGKVHPNPKKGWHPTKETVDKIRVTRQLRAKGRRHSRSNEWRQAVLKNAGFACEHCGTSENLHAHHIVPWKESKELRFDVANGKALCSSCHAKLEGYQKWHKHSSEVRKKLSDSHKGKIPWIKGKKFTEEHKSKLSKALKGRDSWNKGKYTKPESIRKCKICGTEKEIEKFTPQGRYRTRTCKDCRNKKLKKK